MTLNPYQDDLSARLGAPDGHREVIGGLWDEMGALQRDHLLAQGLRPSDRLLDIGCGSLRAGITLAPILEPGHYFGIDLLEELIERGYEHEVRRLGLEARLPRANLAASANFEIPFGKTMFDAALAQSLFSHLPINHLRLCLAQLRPRMREGGRFFATFFTAPDTLPYTQAMRQPPEGAVETFGWQDPYHYWRRDIEFATEGLGWRLETLEDWNHPRGQKMAMFTATPPRR